MVPPHNRLQVRNVYFETVPWALVTGGLITDDGVLEPALLQQRLEAQRECAWGCMLGSGSVVVQRS